MLQRKNILKMPPFLNLEQGTSNISLIRLHTLIHKGNQGPTILAMACLIMNIVVECLFYNGPVSFWELQV